MEINSTNLQCPTFGGQYPLFTIDPSGNPQATEFVLQISSDPDFNFVLLTLTAPIINPFEWMWHRNLDPATTYYWRARHICDGVDGPYTETWSLTAGSGGVILPAPNLITPANGSTLTSLPETFEWTSVTGGIEYLFTMSEVGGSRTTYWWRTGTQIDLGIMDPDTTYEWWVAARNAYAIGDDSDIWQFTTPSGTLSPLQEDQIQLRFYSDGDGIIIVR